MANINEEDLRRLNQENQELETETIKVGDLPSEDVEDDGVEKSNMGTQTSIDTKVEEKSVVGNVADNIIKSGIFNDISNVVMPWFTSRPLKAFANKIGWAASLIIILFSVIIQTITVFRLVNGSAKLFSELGGNLGAATSVVFFLLLLSFILFTFILIAMLYALSNFSNTPDNSFKSNLSLVAIAMVPVAVINIASIVLSFISPLLGIFIYMGGFIALILALYLGFQKHLGLPKMSPYWLFILAILLTIAFTILFANFGIRLYLQIMLRNALSNFNLY